MTEAYTASVIPTSAGMTGFLVLYTVFNYVKLNNYKCSEALQKVNSLDFKE